MKSPPRRFALLLLAFLLSASSAAAELRLPKIFGDHMVLQNGEEINVWGWAEPGAAVVASFAAQSVTAFADKEGRWILKLPEQKPNSKGQELKVSSKDEAIALTDILVGEVWLCSGQSNMQWAMNRSQHGKEEIAKADHPEIRLFAIKNRVAATPQDDVPHAWTACTPQTAAGFTAVGYHFGEALQRELKMPIGLIQSAWGGTEIEPWTPHDGFAKHDSLKNLAKQVAELKPGSAIGNKTPSAIYNAMIHPLAPFSLRGAIWYQGESNCLKGDTAIYTDKTHALVDGWRSVFQQEDLPFYFVQLAPFNYRKAFAKRNASLTTESLPEFWDAQVACLSEIANTGMAVVTDITGSVTNIHPPNKRDVGQRLALWALAKDYGRDDLVYSGPIFKSLALGAGKATLSFDHVGGGLVSDDDNELSQFTIAGSDMKFVPAKAIINGDTIEVSSPDVPQPTAVRYAWHETAVGNLANKDGLPASPFRTDR
ncbi:MAG: sialate O-acetylesterase [Pseudoalteromonas tetraodonis]|jgi:sialate O-acetylesterase